MSLNAFFLYFGGKSQLAPHYPPPRHETIIEPFAGAAGYATRYHHRRVQLIDKDPVVVGIWRYLLGASARDLLALPELGPDQLVEDLPCCQEARWLIGRWIDFGAKAPAKKRSSWGDDPSKLHRTWGRTVRARLAAQVGKIRHWQVREGDYWDAPDVEATWFVDPPYERAGLQYTVSSAGLDFAALGEWCRTRRGQVIVCEESGAEWLPFRAFRAIKALNQEQTVEAIWTNDAEAQAEAHA